MKIRKVLVYQGEELELKPLGKNPAAVALGRLRAAKGDMAAVARLGGLAARGKGGRKPLPRCACGQFTLSRAAKRNHKCEESV
jgi:hypothetical protein